jgi:hypothetical protein
LERTSLDGWCLDAKRFFSLVRGPVLTTLVTTVRTYFILFLGLALLSRATFFPLTFDSDHSDHPDVHVYAHLPTSAFFLGRNFAKGDQINPVRPLQRISFENFQKIRHISLEK